jgi:phosphoglycerol transferase MdoB-like AlkP superfamily enzyme
LISGAAHVLPRVWLRFRLLFALAAASLLVGAALRLSLWLEFGRSAGVAALHVPAILAGGLLNDLVVAASALAPFALYLAALPDRWYRTRVNRQLLTAGTWIALLALVYFAVVEFYFFEEFDARFNLVAFDYLAYPTEVAGDVWQEYPVLLILAAAAIAASTGTWWLRRGRRDAAEATACPRSRLRSAALYATAVALSALAWQTDTLSMSANRVENELVQNGISSFMRAAATSEIDYHANYRSSDPKVNFGLVASELARGGGTFTRLGEGRLDRAHAGRADGLGRLNVVLVSSESFGAEFSRLYGSARDLTPNFDRFAQRGVWFRHAYASGTRTVRGLEAFAASIPPIPTVSILRRPAGEHVATWGGVMQSLGYHTSFLYGGYGYFDNMNSFFGSNGFEIVDRQDIDSARFENVWGISDEDLFDHALAHFDRLHGQGQPFFSIVMTTSNHKPFTFRPGLEHLGIPAEGGGRAAGVRYADFALGEFLRHAERHAWFADTLFIVAADHGARVYGAERIPLRTYEIPVMFYAPRRLPPRRVDALLTQIDVAPTVMGLLGLPYEAPFFGQDALATPREHRIAFFNHNHDVAAYRDGRLAVLGLGKALGTWHYDPASDRYAPAPRDPDLERLAVAYFQTAYEMFEDGRFAPPEAQTRLASRP